MKTFGERLKQLRTQKGLTQAELSSLSGVSQGQIAHLEAGKRKNPSNKTTLALSQALDAPPMLLMMDIPYAPPPEESQPDLMSRVQYVAAVDGLPPEEGTAARVLLVLWDEARTETDIGTARRLLAGLRDLRRFVSEQGELLRLRAAQKELPTLQKRGE